MQTVTELGPKLGVRPLCAALGLAPATYYRRRRAQAVPSRQRPTTSPRALTPAERQGVLDVLHEPRFVDLAPAQVYATLLDEAAISRASARCTASSPPGARYVSAARSASTRSTLPPSCLRPHRTSSGAGTSRSSRDR